MLHVRIIYLHERWKTVTFKGKWLGKSSIHAGIWVCLKLAINYQVIQLWPFQPIVEKVTEALKGSQITIPKRSPAELPGEGCMYLLAFVLHVQLTAGSHHPQDLGCLEKLHENRGCGPENPSYLGCFFIFVPPLPNQKTQKKNSGRRFLLRALCIRLVFLGWILEWNSRLKPGTTCLPKKALGIEATNLHPKKVAKNTKQDFVFHL